MPTNALLYLTHIFPYPGESFPDDELPILSQGDWQIIVLPCGQYHDKKPPLPLPAHVYTDFRLLGHPLAKLLHILTPTGMRLLWQEWRHRRQRGQPFAWPGAIKACASAAFARHKLRQLIREQHLENSPLVVYSFWFSHHAMAMPLLRQEFPQLRYVSRAHGIDVYPERHPRGHLPFHGLRAMTPDILAPCSLHGLQTLQGEGIPVARLVLAHLGVPQVPNQPCPASADNELALVSCSGMLPVKRLSLLVRLLADLARQRPQMRITWHHLGDGPEGTQVRAAVEQLLRSLPNITPVLHGQLTPEGVRTFLTGAHCPLDALVNVSSKEGLPVSMMEALAAGLPVVGPDVGGVAEIITPETGVLLPADCDSKAFLQAMDALPAWKTPQKRARNQAFFAAHFQMDTNYRQFAETILAQQFAISQTLLATKALQAHDA